MTLNAMKAGDRITTTVVFDDGGRYPVHATIQSVFELALRPGFRWAQGTAYLCDGKVSIGIERPQDRFFDDEGVTWLRGWHAPTSDDVVALLAGAALAGETEAVPDVVFDEPSSGGYYPGRYYDFDGYMDDDHTIYDEGSRR